jgi:hypothetical protein
MCNTNPVKKVVINLQFKAICKGNVITFVGTAHIKSSVAATMHLFVQSSLGNTHCYTMTQFIDWSSSVQHNNRTVEWSVLYTVRTKLFEERLSRKIDLTRVDAGSNTSTVTLRVVGGDEKGSLESETVKYGHESYRTRTRKRLCWRGPVAVADGRPVLSSERAPQTNKPATVRQ